jgi:hypothetical protein
MNEVAGLPVVFYIALALLVMASFYAGNWWLFTFEQD